MIPCQLATTDIGLGYFGTFAKCNFRHSEGGHRPTEESIYRIDSSLRPLGFVQNDVEFVILQ